MGGGDSSVRELATYRTAEARSKRCIQAHQVLMRHQDDQVDGATCVPSPGGIKPLKEKLDIASNGKSGSPHTAIFVDGDAFDYLFETRTAEKWEEILLAIEKREPPPIDRCLKFTKTRGCELRPS
jgi:hypothetical protein